MILKGDLVGDKQAARATIDLYEDDNANMLDRIVYTTIFFKVIINLL